MKQDSSSRIPGFHKLDPRDRLARVVELRSLLPEEGDALVTGGIDVGVASRLVENVVGVFSMPLGLAVNLVVNGRDHLVPMVIEEPSVVAAASHGALLVRPSGGVRAEADPSVMIGQVEFPAPADPTAFAVSLREAIPELMAWAGEVLPELTRLGGGLRGMEVRELRLEEEGEVPEVRVVLHFFLDCLDAMGANMVNTLAEALASRIAARHGVRSGLRILSNLADRRLVRAFVEIPFRDLDMPDFPGEAVAEGIASASRFAMVDPYRAATHNKGVFNGIDAVLIATGNDWRAVEAGAHAWAARGGRYTPLSSWRARDGVLRGRIELPMQLGVVGGTLKVHPSVRANLRILGVTSARELAMIATSLGLVQNLAALRALATRGIQEGHMRMHARAVALEVGADELELPLLVARMIEAREYSQAFARHTLEALRCGR